MRGGELLDKLNAEKSLSERETARILFVLIKTIEQLHRNSIGLSSFESVDRSIETFRFSCSSVHRDLQPRNIMYADENREAFSLRIVDFGFAKQQRAENGMLMTPCFTKEYAAPEVLSRKKYDESCDICKRIDLKRRDELLMFFSLGSLGILFYTLLAGNTPFALDRNDSHEVILARTSTKLQLTGPTWNRVSNEAKVCRDSRSSLFLL